MTRVGEGCPMCDQGLKAQTKYCLNVVDQDTGKRKTMMLSEDLYLKMFPQELPVSRWTKFKKWCRKMVCRMGFHSWLYQSNKRPPERFCQYCDKRQTASYDPLYGPLYG